LSLSIAPCVRASEPSPPPGAARDELDEADQQERVQALKDAVVLCWRNDLSCFAKLKEVVALDQTVATAPLPAPAELAFDGMYAYPRNAWAFASLRLVVKKGVCDLGIWRVPNRSKTPAVLALPAAPEALLRIASAEVAQDAWPQDWKEFKNKIEPAILDCAAHRK
jgi:hypothetical protein